MNILLIGFKGCGKTTMGLELARILNFDFVDLDRVLEDLYEKREGETLSFREIYKKHGKDYFRKSETAALKSVNVDGHVIGVGGGTPLTEGNVEIMRQLGKIVFLKVDKEQLYIRIMKNGVPAFFDADNPHESFEKLYNERMPIYEKAADFVVDVSVLKPQKAAEKIKREWQEAQ